MGIKSRLLGNRGQYEILTTFFLVVTILVVVIGLLFVNSFVLAQESNVFDKAELLSTANDVKKNILDCYGPLTPEKIADKSIGENCLSKLTRNDQPRVRGMKFEELQFLSCPKRESEIGENSACAPQGERFVFLTTVNEGSLACVAQLELCLYKIGGKRA
ncbi:MAG: hypothetical protein Q7R47_02765 [Candidatus Diapherotrites archaeon]|nr:hypothetical protein [Candidatus Diapherotrites archaeon]